MAPIATSDVSPTTAIGFPFDILAVVAVAAAVVRTLLLVALDSVAVMMKWIDTDDDNIKIYKEGYWMLLFS